MRVSHVLNGWIFGAALLLAACGSTSTESVTGPSAPKCSVSLTAPAESISASGGAGTVVVSTQPECAWTATAEASWITELAPSQGQGDGQVQFQVEPNPNGTARNGAININGQRATIQQGASACQLDISVSGSQFPASGGAGVVTVAAPGGCAWTASSTVSWIVISAPAGSGSGSVNFTVASNSGAVRTGTITVGGLAVTIQQAAANTQTCTVTINPTSQSVPAAGATGISVTVTAPSGCTRPATSNAAWITIASGATGSGNGTVTLNVAANTGTARTGTVTIGGQTFTVNQAAANTQTCTVTINPTSQSVPAAGATGISVAVSTATGCTWTSTSQASWLTITAGASGSGNGSVTLNAAANTGGVRSGTATIGGQTFTVNQAAAAPQCSYSINPTAQTVGSQSGTGLPVAVTAGAGCAWTSTSSVGWLQITSGSSGTGNGTVNFTFSNFSGSTRTGTLTIAGLTFTVTQVRCTITLTPSTQSVPALGGTFTASVTTQTGCQWTAVRHGSWITVTSGATGVGSGTFSYLVATNLGGARSDYIDVEGQRLTVNQAAVAK